MNNIDPKLFTLLHKISLKNVFFDDKTPIAKTFYQINIDNLYSVIDFVYKLPYKPTSDPFNWNLVLTERCGTCSTRHTLLVSLARELGLHFELGNAIYPMTPENFPMLREPLEQAGLPYIPESHNFIIYQSYFLDVTFPGDCKLLNVKDLWDISTIAVQDLKIIKTKMYPLYLQTWLKQHNINITLEEYKTLHDIWVKILGSYFKIDNTLQ